MIAIYIVFARILFLVLFYMHDQTTTTPLTHDRVDKLPLRHAFFFLRYHYVVIASLAPIHCLLDMNHTLTWPPTMAHDKRTAYS